MQDVTNTISKLQTASSQIETLQAETMQNHLSPVRLSAARGNVQIAIEELDSAVRESSPFPTAGGPVSEPNASDEHRE